MNKQSPFHTGSDKGLKGTSVNCASHYLNEGNLKFLYNLFNGLLFNLVRQKAYRGIESLPQTQIL